MSSTHPRLLDDPNLHRLLRMVLAHRRWLVLGLIATGISAATEPLIARLAGVLTDQALFTREFSAVVWMPVAFVALFVVRGLAIFAGSYLLNRVSQAVLTDLRMTMFDRMLHWPTTTFENTPSGVVISKFVNEATNALNLAAESISTAVRDSLIVIGLLLMLLYYNWQLTLLTTIVAPPIGLALRAFSRRLRRLNVENQAMLGEMTRAVQEAHEGQRVIKIYDGADYEDRQVPADQRQAARLRDADAGRVVGRHADRPGAWRDRRGDRDDGRAVAGADDQGFAGRVRDLPRGSTAAAAGTAPSVVTERAAGSHGGRVRERVPDDRHAA